MADILQTLWQIVVLLFTQLLPQLLLFVLQWSLVLFLLAWCLWGINWKKAWPTLARGGWAPVVLLAVMGALVWSQIAPADWTALGFLTVANFWWQLGAVGLLVAVVLFCGWLQVVFDWTPAEVELEPPVAEHAHGHEHPVGAMHGHEGEVAEHYGHQQHH